MKSWSQSEVALTVADYLSMLGHELRGEPYSKSAYRRRLVDLLPGRSESAIEQKHRNISAVLIEAGLPYIAGYKPLTHYQRLLAQVTLDQLAVADRLVDTVARDVTAVPDLLLLPLGSLEQVFVAPPHVSRHKLVLAENEKPVSPKPSIVGGINYLEREARNQELGLRGEEFVVRLEQYRLSLAGHDRLAAKVEHVSQTHGDGLGYDVLSYDVDSRERLIEVKTTKYGSETPFYLTRNEVAVSAREADSFHLYRVFSYRAEPKVFTLPGSLLETCSLAPMSFEAFPR